jgi:hypothetical protein
MRSFMGSIAAALLLAGCAADTQTTTSELQAAQYRDRMSQALGFAGKAEVAHTICTERGSTPGTDAHAACMTALLKAEGRRARSWADTLADRAARMSYTCVDKSSYRLVRCFDI